MSEIIFLKVVADWGEKMFEAISYENLIIDLKDRYGVRRKTFAILLVRPNTGSVSSEIVSHLPYFHHRSGDKLDFYLPGYGAYWGSSIPDSKDVCTINATKWSFSTKYFTDFISTLEDNSKWKYKSGSELILLDYIDGEIDFKKVVKVRLDAALKDNAIESVEEFIETVLSIFIKSTNSVYASDVLTLKSLGKGINTELRNKFLVFRLFSRSKHYIINNYER